MGFFDYFLTWTRELDLLFWGPGMIALLLLTGIYLTIRTRGLQFTHFWHSLKLIFSKESRSEEGKGDISPFAALMTALAATLGQRFFRGPTRIRLDRLYSPGVVIQARSSAIFVRSLTTSVADRYRSVRLFARHLSMISANCAGTSDRSDRTGGWSSERIE